mgnify:CR=1 FL=1
MRTKAKKKLLLVTAAFFTGFLVVTIKLSYVMIAQADKYLSLARNLHQRDRESAKRQYLRQKWRKDRFEQSSLFDLCDIFSGDRQGKSNKGLI